MVLNVAAKAVIVNPKGQVLIMRESSAHDTNTKAGHYQLPGGRIDTGEALLDGLRREVLEETGIELEVGQPLLAGEWRPVIKGVPHQIIGTFFACKTTATDVRLSEEHDDALWIDPAERAKYDIVSPDDAAIDAYVKQFAKPLAGVGLLIIKDGKVLLGKRKGSIGAGEYGLVGGHVEYGETLEQAVLRELSEECGIEVQNVRMLCVSDLLNYPPKHYVDIGFVADWKAGEPKVLEPDKREGWEWVDLGSIPENVFGTTREYIEAYRGGKTYFTVR
jgi:8-oxo-dGTP diphosphatase